MINYYNHIIKYGTGPKNKLQIFIINHKILYQFINILPGLFIILILIYQMIYYLYLFFRYFYLNLYFHFFISKYFKS
jgi:hypothetical protein